MSRTPSGVSHDALKAAPQRLIELPLTDKFSFGRADLEEIQLAALRKRFDDLVTRVSVLRRFAEEQGLREIRSIEDGSLLLLPHTMYKSYPLSAIEKGRWDTMTKWLGTLSAIDLSAVDTAGCETIDDWIDRLDAQSEVRVRHSSGTSGKLSFVPMSVAESIVSIHGIKRAMEGFGDEAAAQGSESIGDLPLIAFGYRHGSQSFPRSIDAIVEHFYGGDESRVLCLNPGRISADMASLAGRLEGAQTRGALGRDALSPGLMARRDRFLAEQALAPKYLDDFYDTIATRFRGQKVVLKGVLPPVVTTAVEGLRRDLSGLFDPASPFFVAGGAKGQSLPDDYRDQVTRFTGVPFPPAGYGMSEAASAITLMCPRGHYHIVPNLIPYLVHPDTGAVLPRVGTQTGRFGIIDVGCQSRWGGFLTGDEITLNYGDMAPCGCGRKGTYIQGEIRRYSELRGGDDKITCAGAPGIHDKALDFIAGVAG